MAFNRFSPTMLSVYKKCPRAFKYRYIDKLGEKFKQPRPFFSLGNSVHSALEKFMGYGLSERNQNLLQTILEKEWISEGYLNKEQEEDFFHRAVDMLNNFYKSGEWKAQPDFIEQGFEVEIADFTLRGRIDRMDGLNVIEYKTGNYIPSIDDLKSDFQAIIYSFAGRQLAALPVKNVIFYFLGPGKKISVSKTEEELGEDMEGIKKLIGKIRGDKEFFPTPHRIWCLYCDFNCICPLAGVMSKEEEPAKLTDLMMKGTEDAYINLYEILNVSTTLSGILDFDTLTKQIIDVFRSFSDCTKLFLFMRSAKGAFYIRGMSGVNSSEIQRVKEALNKMPDLLDGRLPSVLSKPLADSRFSNFFSGLDLSENPSAAVIPLFARERQMGSVVLVREGTVFTQKDIITLNTLANIAQISLDNSIHYTQAIIDDLTGLYVRKYFERRLADELARFKRFKTPFTVCMFDIDFFKKVNDTYGHPFGDKILVQFAGVLKDSLRNIDVIVRFGGEEFMALLPETDCTAGYSVAERIRQGVSEHSFGDGEIQVELTTSIGILPVPPDAKNFQECIEKVDKPLYRAKQSGRNCVKIYGRHPPPP